MNLTMGLFHRNKAEVQRTQKLTTTPVLLRVVLKKQEETTASCQEVLVCFVVWSSTLRTRNCMFRVKEYNLAIYQ